MGQVSLTWCAAGPTWSLYIITNVRYGSGEFDLVCSRSYLVSTAQTLYFFGMIFGVFTFGLLGRANNTEFTQNI